MDEEIDRRTPAEGAASGSGGSGADAELAAQAEAEAIVEATKEASLVELFGTPARADVIEELRPVREAAAAAIGDPARLRRGPSSAVLAATLFLIGSTILSVSFMLTRGGLALPVASPQPTDVALASPSSSVTNSTPPPAPTATPGASPTPRPTPRTTPSPTPDPRLALLEPCPGTPDCYIYTVQTNDRLAKIAVRFGVPFDTILELNPWITDPNVIHPGDEITLPPPGP